jgi:hypothetical protein
VVQYVKSLCGALHGCKGSDDYNRAEMINSSHANEFPGLS